jgi:hypothetical protein
MDVALSVTAAGIEQGDHAVKRKAIKLMMDGDDDYDAISNSIIVFLISGSQVSMAV